MQSVDRSRHFSNFEFNANISSSRVVIIFHLCYLFIELIKRHLTEEKPNENFTKIDNTKSLYSNRILRKLPEGNLWRVSSVPRTSANFSVELFTFKYLPNLFLI